MNRSPEAIAFDLLTPQEQAAVQRYHTVLQQTLASSAPPAPPDPLRVIKTTSGAERKRENDRHFGVGRMDDPLQGVTT